MPRAIAHGACCLLLAAVTLPTVAQDAPPPVRSERRTESKPAPRYEAPIASGAAGIRPFIGAWGDMNVDDCFRFCAVTGNKFVFGVDFVLGEPTGVGYALGLHLGAGQGDFVLQPLAEIVYRWDLGLGIPLVPWAGGGISLKLGFSGRFEMALTFRGAFGVEYYVTDKVAIFTQLALPDIGPRLIPDITPVGTVEWIIGPHIRL